MSPAQANQPLPSGFMLEQYRIVRQISLGGFSIVYLAHDAREMPVAIKEYLPNALALRAGESPEPVVAEIHRTAFNHGLRCFFEEGSILARLNHANVVRVVNFFRANGTAYLVMQYERGRTLLEHIQKRSGALEEDQVRGIFGRLLNGLREVHSQKLLHLDIKPANIYLRNDGNPVLLDFGAARQVIGLDAPLLKAMHTPGYAAPEQYGRQEDFGPWTDIYAVGASLYASLGGQAPLAADKRLEEDALVPATKAFAARYSRQLLETVDACLQLDHLRRPQSVFALQQQLASSERGGSGLLGRIRGLLQR
ncbi:MAG: serine/threonine protein kinase [Rhodocyclaceae bacterium]|nr:serine/threonine protein kinase [Rhodocyclaceae bacterium]